MCPTGPSKARWLVKVSSSLFFLDISRKLSSNSSPRSLDFDPQYFTGFTCKAYPGAFLQSLGGEKKLYPCFGKVSFARLKKINKLDSWLRNSFSLFTSEYLMQIFPLPVESSVGYFNNKTTSVFLSHHISILKNPSLSQCHISFLLWNSWTSKVLFYADLNAIIWKRYLPNSYNKERKKSNAKLLGTCCQHLTN